MAESYDPTPTHPSSDLEPSLKVKDGLSGWVIVIPHNDIVRVIHLYSLEIYYF